MWADTLFRAEQQHALGLLLWAGASIVAGTSLITMTTLRRVSSPLLRQFAIQMIAWGIVAAVVGGLSWGGLAMRDVAGAARLERMVWMALGMEIGMVGVGATLATSMWLTARRPGGIGAGIGVMVQGLAVLVLDLRLVSVLSR